MITFTSKDKLKIRKLLLERRLSLSTEEVSSKSKEIANNLFSLGEINSAQNIAIYLSFKNEVETKQIIEKLWKSKKNVFVPITNSCDSCLSFAKINSFSELVLDSREILEPKEKEIIFPEEIDLFIVPGIAFDFNGNRLGFGKGFYDKFFSKNLIQAKKITLAFEFQVLEKLPFEEHDVKIDIIVSEKSILII